MIVLVFGEIMTGKDSLIEWNVRFKIGIPLIDSQHQKLVMATNNLHAACRQSRETAKSSFIHVAREVAAYVQYHFTTEEKMMLLLEFPDYPAHKKEHELFVKEVLQQIKNFSKQNNLVPTRFVYFLKEWILSHIAVCDKAMAEYIMSLRQTKKLQALFPHSA